MENEKNYGKISTEYGDLSINARTVILTSATDSKDYDGEELKAETVTVSGDGFIEGEGASYSDFASIVEVGEVENSFEYTLNEGTDAKNYKITKEEGTLTIRANEKAIVISSEDYSWTYDGKTHTYEEYTVTYDGKEVDVEEVGDHYEATLPTGDKVVITPTTEGEKDVVTGKENNTFKVEVENEKMKGYLIVSTSPSLYVKQSKSQIV